MPFNTQELFGDLFEGPASSLGPQYHESIFYQPLINCSACACRAEATKVVPGVGPQRAEIVFIGRNPGRNEDQIGLPFVGRGGGELDRMLQALDIDRQKVAIWNVVKCHTMGDRPPKPIEIETCTTLWLGKEIDTFNKVSIVFPMGREAIQVMLGQKAESPARREGYWMKVDYSGRILHVCPLNHPGYLLRNPSMQGRMYNLTLPAVKNHLMTEFRAVYERSRQT
jgi:DNA polymerase